MATIDVKDASDNTVAIEKPLAPGRAAAAASRPVVLSTEDAALLDGLETLLTSLLALLPTALGQGTMAQSLKVVIASDQSALNAKIVDSGGTPITYNANGQATMANSAPVAIASNQSDVPISNTPLTNIGAGEYETVAASQTDQVLGATGAVGDFLAGLLVIPATTSPGNVLIQDGNGSDITVFTGGASSVSNLVPFFIPLGIKCANATSAGWKVTTGANVSVLGIGNFT